MNKKIMASALSVAMLSAAFTGMNVNTATAATKLKPVTLKWYTIGAPMKDLPLVNKAINKYLKSKINAQVQITQFDWGDYEQKMNVKINSGENFDLCFTCSWSLNYKQNAKKGAFKDVTALVNKYGKDMLKVINPNFIKGNKVEGPKGTEGLYAVPNNKEIGQQSVFRFNKKYVDKYHLDISKVKVYQDLEPLLKVIHEKEPNMVSPFRVGGVQLNQDNLIDNIPIDLDLDSKSGKLENWCKSKKTIAYLNLARKWYKAGYIRPDAVAALKNGGDEEKTGSWFVDVAGTQPYADQLWSSSLGYKIVSMPMYSPITNNTSVSGSMIAVSSTSKNPERAVMFLNLLNSDKYLRNLVNYGIAGTHYTKKGGDYIVQTKKGKTNYDMPAFSLGNVFLTYLPEGTPADKWKKFDEFNKASKNSPMLGFDFDTDKVKNELASVKSVRDEFNDALVSGSVDPKEYLPKFEDKLKAAGIDKVIKEAQKQYDAWKAKHK